MTVSSAIDSTYLLTAVDDLAQQLGSKYKVKRDYSFAAPNGSHLIEHRANAVIFSSPIPSMHSATIGFKVFSSDSDVANSLEQFAYLGAPVLVTVSESNVSIYHYHGTPVPNLLEQYSSSDSSAVWQRLSQRFESVTSEISLFPGYGKDLLIGSTKTALVEIIRFLVQDVLGQNDLTELEAFQTAIGIIRHIVLGEPLQVPQNVAEYAEEAIRAYSSRISFANLPPEAIAEMYEKFAVTPSIRRRLGIFYTPSWLARYVISRLPVEAFRSGTAIDPTCGSGTFLVCFLERLIEDLNRRSESPTSQILKSSVKGIDIDPVAIEATRLSLDFFCKTLELPVQDWDLITADAKDAQITGEWVIGNLPFGFRTDAGNRDISSTILENMNATNDRIKAFSLVLPDSITYTRSAANVRALLRTEYLVQEITQLPERVFEHSLVHTVVMCATKTDPRQEVVIRGISQRNLASFRRGSSITKSFIARFPDGLTDPWRFSPFSNEFEIAAKLGMTLGEISEIHIGLQIYGVPRVQILSKKIDGERRPLLEEPSQFKVWNERSIGKLENLNADKNSVRRPGPWSKFPNRKVILRSTTNAESFDRLSAVADEQGVWFTDKFVGVWPTLETLSTNALAAYFQTRFVQAWFATHNPSRKLRISTLAKLPIPKLPAVWWSRAEKLAPSNTFIKSVAESSASHNLFWQLEEGVAGEWDWFNRTVEAGLGITPIGSNRFKEWIQLYSDQENTTRKT